MPELYAKLVDAILKQSKMKAPKAHDESVVAMLKTDPELADAYRAAALRHIAEAQGVAQVEVSR